MANLTRKVSLLFLIYFILNFNDVNLQGNKTEEENELNKKYEGG